MTEQERTGKDKIGQEMSGLGTKQDNAGRAMTQQDRKTQGETGQDTAQHHRTG